MQEELEGLKDSLRAEQKATNELTDERERLRKLLEEKESALLVCESALLVCPCYHPGFILCLEHPCMHRFGRHTRVRFSGSKNLNFM